MRRAVAIALVLFATTRVTGASADNIWQKAQKPPATGLLGNDEVHRQVALAYYEARETKVTNPVFGGHPIVKYTNALDLLVRHKAATSSDPRLRYDLGFVLAKLPDCKEAVVAFENAYSFAKGHPFAEDALFELAICYSKLGRHAEEEGAYLRALDAADGEWRKAMIYSNLAESRLAQGKLALGVEAAEMAIDLDADSASPRYNLAILQDRLGFEFAALEAAKHAVEYDPKSEFLDGKDVFFEPAYELHWYHALRALALAEREEGDARTKLLMKALVHYREWLEESEPTDRYRKRCEENIARLEKQLKLKKK